MSFKLHLIIISCIIVAVLLAWELMRSAPAVAPAPALVKSSHVLSITHASWGLNCRNMAINNEAASQDAFAKKQENNKLREDNVLGPVSLLCNSNTDCDITADEDTLGNDPAPECSSKVLEVEYRCFSYDRPWNVKSSTGTLSLHCEQPSEGNK